MTTVYIKYAPTWKFLVGADGADIVRTLVKEGKYTAQSALFNVQGDSKDAAEEVFDLTNHPGRQHEREKVYGNGRSLSVGDIVVVGEEQWICMSFGWAEL